MSEKQKEPGKKKGTPGRKKFVPTDEEGSVRCCIWRLFAVCGRLRRSGGYRLGPSRARGLGGDFRRALDFFIW